MASYVRYIRQTTPTSAEAARAYETAPRVASRKLVLQAIARTQREAEDPTATVGGVWRYRSRDGMSDAEISRDARKRLMVLRALL